MTNNIQPFDSNNEFDIQEEINRSVINIFYCVKYKNSGKLSSHLWFFKGFCE